MNEYPLVAGCTCQKGCGQGIHRLQGFMTAPCSQGSCLLN